MKSNTFSRKKVNNILYINKSADDGLLSFKVILNLFQMKGFQSSRSNYVSYIENKLKSKDKNIVLRQNTFTVRVLGFDINVPLFVMFRALGIIR